MSVMGCNSLALTDVGRSAFGLLELEVKTYRITVELRSPVIAMPYGLGLDSLLSAASFQASGLVGHEAMSSVPVVATRFNAGADLSMSSGSFILYHASCAYFANPVSFSKETIVRRRRRDEIGPEFFAGAKPRKGASKHPWSVDQDTGDYLALLQDYQVTNTQSLVWYVDTDQPQVICDLLASLAFIGKRRGQGFGELGQVSYRVAGGDNGTALFDANGYPRRPIPLSFSENYACNKNARVEPSSGYSISAWENEPILCVMPPSPYIDIGDLACVDEDGFIG